MDEIRRQLAELMDSVETDSNRKSFTDANICKPYLTGLCIHDLFQNTKQYMGECPNVHSDDLKEQYREARKKANYGYEEMTLRQLRPHIDDCDRRITRQTLGGRCDTQDKASESIEASARRQVELLESQIAEKMKEAEELGNKGDVEGSIQIMDEINQLNVQKKVALDEKSSKVEEAKNMYFQKLKPCEICGALLSEKDGENRLNEHYLGRIHLGFEAIRKHVKELEEYVSNIGSKLPRDPSYNVRPLTSMVISPPTSIADTSDHRGKRSVEPDLRSRDENSGRYNRESKYSGESHRYDTSYGTRSGYFNDSSKHGRDDYRDRYHRREPHHRDRGDSYEDRHRYHRSYHPSHNRRGTRRNEAGYHTGDGPTSNNTNGDAKDKRNSHHNYYESDGKSSSGRRDYERSCSHRSRSRGRRSEEESSKDLNKRRREERRREERRSTSIRRRKNETNKIESEEEEGQIDQK